MVHFQVVAKRVTKQEIKMRNEIEEMDSDEHRHLIEDVEALLERAKPPNLVPSCCIYKVPQGIRKEYPEAYTPKVVSIGPLHHADKGLKPMEELKLGYLKCYIGRTNMKLKDCIGMLKEKEGYIRSCYAETISQSSNDFVKMILIDACFIIEYFLRFLEIPQWAKTDPILSKPSQRGYIRMDLIFLENQLPFFVLEKLFTLTRIEDKRYSSFLEVSFRYFKISLSTIGKLNIAGFPFDYFHEHHLMKRSSGEEGGEVQVQHFTDLLRIMHLPCPESQPKTKDGIIEHLYSASQLLEAGVKFKASQDKSLIELQFEEGVLKMPQLVVDGYTKPILLNMAALEQCHYPDETYIGDYINLLDLLINDRKDADIIVDKGLMICIGDIDYKVATAFNNIGRGMVVGCNADYAELEKNLNDFCQKPLNKYKAIFIRDYLSTPWKIASFTAAIVLLLLTLVQTICSVIQLRSSKGS